ncbi:N-acetylmuramoyl-L-alanine amidase [Streptomyces sp. ME01-24h]|nr:N-acetylmuramoyl-L-alanine amidase [Streptomyces sp. ME01-24h]
MAKTGPQKIPGASQAYFFGAGQYSGSDMEVNCGVVHTTEGMTLPSYSGGSMAPNVTGVPDFKAKKIRWYQHFDVDESARALENRPGGVQTNTANAFQIELVGTCDDSKKASWSGKKAGVDYLHWPTAPDWALAEVASLVRWLNANHGIPLTCVKDWLAYGKDSRRPGVTPASYGASPARMSFAQWQAFKGWCGHQHVPEQDHGDPGSLNFARIIQLAKGENFQEDDMDPIDVWAYKGKTNPAGTGTETHDAYWYLREAKTKVDTLATQLAALTATVTTLAGQLGQDVDTDAVVAAVEAAIAKAVVKVDVTVADNT